MNFHNMNAIIKQAGYLGVKDFCIQMSMKHNVQLEACRMAMIAVDFDEAGEHWQEEFLKWLDNFK